MASKRTFHQCSREFGAGRDPEERNSICFLAFAMSLRGGKHRYTPPKGRERQITRPQGAVSRTFCSSC